MQMQDPLLSMPGKGNHTKEVAMRRTAPALTVSCEGVWRPGKDEREVKRDSTGSKVGDAKDERLWEGESGGAGRATRGHTCWVAKWHGSHQLYLRREGSQRAGTALL